MNASGSCGVALIDPHAIVRDGIKALLAGESGFHVTGEAGDLSSLGMARLYPEPRLVVSESRLRPPDPADVVGAVRRAAPGARVLMLSMWDDAASVTKALRDGAAGFVSKRSGASELLRAMRAVAGGGTYWASLPAGHGATPGLAQGPSDHVSMVGCLTPREKQVLTMVAEGRRSRQIAVELGLSVETVRTYRKTIVKKLEVGSVAEMTHIALASGLTRLSVNGVRTS